MAKAVTIILMKILWNKFKRSSCFAVDADIVNLRLRIIFFMNKRVKQVDFLQIWFMSLKMVNL